MVPQSALNDTLTPATGTELAGAVMVTDVLPPALSELLPRVSGPSVILAAATAKSMDTEYGKPASSAWAVKVAAPAVEMEAGTIDTCASPWELVSAVSGD